jgi:bifunctional non-homologous end joining protein LigD
MMGHSEGKQEGDMGLETYQRKRDFSQTPEPKGKISRANKHRFVVQEHHARKLHFDFRLEMGGVLKSWSIPKGPSQDPADKRFAVPTEDHPVEYLEFEGHIPAGNYGAGEHMIWDAGTYELLSGDDPVKQLAAGKLRLSLHGKKLQGEFNLFRMSGREDQWLLVKARDRFAEAGWKLKLLMDTHGTGESLDETKGAKRERAPKKSVKRLSTKTDGEVVPASRAFKAKELVGDINVRVGRETVALTNLDKLYWPEDGYTKGDLIRYYYEVSKYILPYLKDRPLIMKRYPNGIGGPFFHQHDVDEAPGFVRTVRVDVEEGHEVDYIVGDNLATLLYMANLGAIERHPWHSRVRDLDHPDWFVFDLDPDKAVEFSTICELALSVRDLLNRIGLESYAKTSGSRGIHVYVPIKPVYSYEEVAALAEAVATRVAEENAQVATVERSLKKRKRGQIYVDHMQNARGKSVVAPYSVRPRRGATVSAPLEWSEVKRRKITIQDFNIKTMGRRLSRQGDLFKAVLSRRQSLAQAFEEVKDWASKPLTRRAGA